MNPRANYLPEHWQKWVAEHPNLSKGELTSDFNNHVYIQWEDGSYMHFRYAFLVVDYNHKELGVFTEHCGYYCFPMRGIERYGMMKHQNCQTIGEYDGD